MSLIPPHKPVVHTMKKIYRLDIIVAEVDLDVASGMLALSVPFGWEEESLPTGETSFHIHCENRAFLQKIQSALLKKLPEAVCRESSLYEQDWTAAWKQFFTPVSCGRRFVVLPPWLADTQDFPDRTSILIEPKSAFGTGHHATTELCLTVLSDLLDTGRLRAGQRFLDVGTGSGILGIACCKSGLFGDGCDIDALAVENARENCRLNGLSDFCVHSGSIEAIAGKTYDLVLANILSGPLVELAQSIVQACKPGACLVLSGLLDIQADKVEAAYLNQCLPKARRVFLGEWCALVWDAP